MKIRLRFGIVLVFIAKSVLAQTPSVSFENISIKDGLVGDHILCVFQDSKGFIWIGTYAGLHRYDGYGFKVFNRDVPIRYTANLIADNTVYSIIEDKRHKFWIGTEKGLSRYDPELDSFTNYYPTPLHPSRGPSHGNIRCIYEDDEGYIWMGTYGGGLNRFDPATQRFHHFKNASSFLPGNRINDFYVDKTNRFWIGTEGDGLVLFDQQNETFTYFRHDPEEVHSISSNIVNKIIEDKSGKLWVATWGGGVCRFDPRENRFRRYGYEPDSKGGLKSNTIRSLLEDSRGRLWLATFGGGLSLYDRSHDTFTTYISDNSNPSSLSNNILWTLFEDRHGLMWIGTYGSGLDILNPTRESFIHYETNPSQNELSSNQISAFCETRDGRIWIGTVDGGINILDRHSSRIARFTLLKEHPLTTMRTIYEDSSGNIWIGTDKGLYLYDPFRKKLKHYMHDPSNPHSIKNNGVYCIQEGGNKTIWAGTWDSGLNRLDHREYVKPDPRDAVFRHYSHLADDSTSLSSNKIWTSYMDKNGELWFGTEKSLDKFDPETESFVHFGSMNVGRIIEDQAGILWIGTYGQGLARFNPKTNKINYYNQLKNIDINLILDMVPDNDENIWIGSIDGITKFNTRTEEFINLDLANELGKNEYEINVITRLKSGEFILGGDFGIDIFNPEKIKTQEIVPPVELTDFQIFNESVPAGLWKDRQILRKTISYTNAIDLTHKENLISIEFAALYFSSQEKHQYAYKLDGFDQQWNYTRADNRKATYMNLKPGRYTFRVKGATREGGWSRERTLSLNIAPPFWDTLSFKLTSGMFFTLGFILFFRRRIRSERARVLRKYNAEKLLKEQEIIKLRNESLDAELEHKKKELASSTLHNMQKNEELSHVRDELKAIVAELRGNSQEKKIKKLIASIDSNIAGSGNWEYFEKNFNLLHEDFLKRLMSAFPRLTHKDLRICAFIRMNFDNKEIAKILNITSESLGVSRTRIRKKIGLDKHIYLNDFIMRF